MHNLENNMLWDMDMEKEFQNTVKIKTLLGISISHLHVTVIISIIV
jgi:hypothetical protein